MRSVYHHKVNPAVISFSFIHHNPAKDVPKEVNTFINKNF